MIYEILKKANGVFVIPSESKCIDVETNIASIGNQLRAYGIIEDYSDYIDILISLYPQHVPTIMQQATSIFNK